MHLHITIKVCTLDVTDLDNVLLALQYTCFSLSFFPALLINDEIVLTKPALFRVLDVDWLVITNDDMYHVILAGGLL